ncbi:hypothetical protein PRUPE_5G135000 [Prunus persica]|uniref:Secreted protein n=1 Tax=Prunus persica TaxID=3760 RepID=A0A251P7W4_PRUPE|nr:hypothetical protein PRUPE_5G135000 [Prunus persica]
MACHVAMWPAFVCFLISPTQHSMSPKAKWTRHPSGSAHIQRVFHQRCPKEKSNGSDQLGFHFLFRYYNLITDCTHSCRNQKSDIKREEEEEVTKKLVGFCYGFQNFGVKDRALTATVQRQPIP